ncbi:MAG: DUF6655 family protein [Pirellulaceae bacterium]
MIALVGGCGSTKSRAATDQLLLSDAVDKSVSAIDFRPLSGKTVYLDATYLLPVKGLGFVNSEYIISSLRQQIVAAGCLLQDDRKDAELIIEARVGTLGADGYQVTYGIPASNALSTASSLLPQAPPLPTIPEIALGRRESSEASAKIAAFAYHRETRVAVWQSGVSRSESDARDTWVMGVGPFESGTVRDSTQLAGKSLPFDEQSAKNGSPTGGYKRPPVDYSAEVRFEEGYPILPGAPVQPAILSESADSLVVNPDDGKELKQVSFEEIEKRTESDSK